MDSLEKMDQEKRKYYVHHVCVLRIVFLSERKICLLWFCKFIIVYSFLLLLPFFSTLMKSLANYALPGLNHLKILLVDQHVEGDEDSPLQWLLRADVERTALLEDEARINTVMYAREAARSGTVTELCEDLEEEFAGVNLDAALEECYERMNVIGELLYIHIVISLLVCCILT